MTGFYMMGTLVVKGSINVVPFGIVEIYLAFRQNVHSIFSITIFLVYFYYASLDTLYLLQGNPEEHSIEEFAHLITKMIGKLIF